eukprot:scaffold1744_cov340-Prasinococcus_capsulatus_cf.AAC.15
MSIRLHRYTSCAALARGTISLRRRRSCEKLRPLSSPRTPYCAKSSSSRLACVCRWVCSSRKNAAPRCFSVAPLTRSVDHTKLVATTLCICSSSSNSARRNCALDTRPSRVAVAGEADTVPMVD